MAAAALPIIGSLVGGILGGNAANRAGNAINDTAISAEHGVLDNSASGQTQVQNTLGGNAINVNAGVNAGNNALSSGLASTTQNLNPYLQGGQQGTNSLQQYAASNPQFTAPTAAQVEATPGYQFQLGQGSEAITNQAAASGLANSGNTLKALTQYGQGLASTYYQNAFNNAQNAFTTNRDTTQQNLGMLINSGLNASGQFTGANTTTAGQISNNSLGGAIYNAGQDLQGGEFGANLGMTGAEQAGQFALTGAEAHAGGIQGQANALGNGISGALGGVSNIQGPSWWSGTPKYGGGQQLDWTA